MPVICIVLLAVIYIQIQHYLPQIRTFYIFWQMSLVIRVWLAHVVDDFYFNSLH
jgi:hypothetical protein